MFKQILVLSTFLVGSVFSRNATFNVIAFGNKVQLSIQNGSTYDLTPVNEDGILYSATIEDAPEETFKYHYIVDDVAESFNRKFDEKMTKTYNEFFEREKTIEQLKTFDHPANFTNWNRSIGKTSLFDDSYIPTVHITGSNTETFFHNPTRYSYSNIKLENVTFYLKDSVESFSKVSANAKNYEFSRFQIKMSLGNNQDGKKGINGRYVLKLRTGGEDPTNLRQLIYGNIIQALGMPSIHSIMVRVYYNKKPAGFYTLQETAPSDSFINSEFYGNPETGVSSPPRPIGQILDGTTGADFEYKPDDDDYYGLFDSDDDSRDKVIAFCEALSELDTSNQDELNEFESKWFDIDTFHKAMAMEYLTGHWDGYWYTTNNYVFYDDPTQSTEDTYKFYFITQDHDETFGVGLYPPINNVGRKFPNISYTTMLNQTWNIAEDDAKYRTLVDKFIASTPALHQRFANTLISIVQTVFNPVAFTDVVESYYKRYKPEMKWDYSFTRPYVAKNESPSFNYNDFKNNFKKEIDELQWGLYEWVELRSAAIKKEFCITWKGDKNPPSKSCVPTVKF